LSRALTLFLVVLFAVALAYSGVASAAPDYGEAERNMRSGVENLRQENYEEAIEDLEAVRAALPGSSMAAYYLGIAYKRTQDFERARTNLERAITLEPAVREAVVELADVYFQTGAIEKSMAMVETAEAEGIRPAETAFLKGLVLIKLRRYNEAVTSFENAVALDESLSSAAEYHIGMARMLEGSFAEAKEVFLSTIRRDPDTGFAALASEYLDAISKRLWQDKPLKLTAWAGLIYDDNVILKPGDDTVAGAVTDKEDTGYTLSLRAEYMRPLEGRYSLEARYSFYLLDYFELSSHDVMSHAVTVAPSYSALGAKISVPVSVAYTMVDGYGYLTTLRAAPSYSFEPGSDTLVRLSAGVESNGFHGEPTDPDEDRDNIELGFMVEWFRVLRVSGKDLGAKDGQGLLTANYGFTSSDSDGRNWSHLTNTIGAGVAYPIAGRMRAALNAEASIQNFTGTHTVFGKKRRDRTYTLATTLSYSLTDFVEAMGGLTYVLGKSNLALYDYDKFVLSAGVQARF